MKTVQRVLPEGARKLIAETILSQPFKDLCNVVSSLSDESLINALNDGERGALEGSNRVLSAEDHQHRSLEYKTFLKVAQEMRGIAVRDKAFYVVEIKPTEE